MSFIGATCTALQIAKLPEHPRVPHPILPDPHPPHPRSRDPGSHGSPCHPTDFQPLSLELNGNHDVAGNICYPRFLS